MRPWDLEAEQLLRASLLLFFLLFSDPRPRDRLRLLERLREPTGAMEPRAAGGGQAYPEALGAAHRLGSEVLGPIPISTPGQGYQKLRGNRTILNHPGSSAAAPLRARPRRDTPRLGRPPAPLGMAATFAHQVRSEPLPTRSYPPPPRPPP